MTTPLIAFDTENYKNKNQPIVDKSTIISLAPNEAAYKRAEKLATITKWHDLSGNEQIVWGECKSSGAQYYKVQLSLTDDTYKCNCPSRKFPCKHALALMMLFVDSNDIFMVSYNPPDWVKDWLANKRTPKKAPTTEETKAAQEKKAALKAKNKSARLVLMQSGISELKIWLYDIIKQGTAALKEQPPEFWDTFAARMVDAKLGGIAKRIRLLPTLPNDANWNDNMLAELADLYLLAKGFDNLESLPDTLQKDILSIAGWNIKKEEVENLPSHTDDWLILAIHEKWEEKLRARKTWLFGLKTKKYALILDFAWGSEDFKKHYTPGKIMNGGIIYYPAAFPLRAIENKLKFVQQSNATATGYENIASLAHAYSVALAQNPWINTFPAILSNVVPVPANGKFLLVDTGKQQLEIANDETSFWQIFALSGGNPIRVFGEWNKNKLLILSVLTSDRFIDFSIRVEKRSYGAFPF